MGNLSIYRLLFDNLEKYDFDGQNSFFKLMNQLIKKSNDKNGFLDFLDENFFFEHLSSFLIKLKSKNEELNSKLYTLQSFFVEHYLSYTKEFKKLGDTNSFPQLKELVSGKNEDIPQTGYDVIK